MSSRRNKWNLAFVVAALAVVVIVLAAGYFVLMQRAAQTGGTWVGTSQTNSSESRAASSCNIPPGGTKNVTITAQFPPCDCALVQSNSNGSLFVSTNARVGDNVCLTASLNNSATVYLAVENSAGKLVYSPGMCAATGRPGAPPPTGDTCTAYWDTTRPDTQGNPIGPGTYHLIASSYEGAPISLQANFTLS